MSLPQTKKQTTEKPAPGSVVDPLNKETKEANIDRQVTSFLPFFLPEFHSNIQQLQLYGVIEAFRNGKLPDNAQIDSTLQYVLNHSPIEVDKLSPDGKKLIQDTKDIIGTARLIVAQKNVDELFQNFVWHTRDVDTTKIKRDPKDLTPSDSNGDPAEDKQQGKLDSVFC
jgi:hypothetical protein